MRDICTARRGVARRTLLAWAVGAAVSARAEARARHKSAEHKPPEHKKAEPRGRKLLRTVVVDAGHGGRDPGAVSPHGTYEKNVTLPVARELARQLAATGRYRPVLTRRGDTFVPLRQRVARARDARAELFLSIHADALPDAGLRGLSVYTLSDQASDREAAALAVRENKDGFAGALRLSSRPPPVIGAILLDLAQRRTNNSSLTLAHAIVADLGHVVPLLETPHREAGFVVLTAPDIPSALVELGCLSNAEDERLMLQRAYQRRLAEGLARAIDDFFAARVTA